MHSNYEYGYRVANHKGYDQECMDKAVPFPVLDSNNVDAKISSPPTHNTSFHVSRFCKKLSKTKHSSIYVLAERKYDSFLTALSKHTEETTNTHSFKPITVNNKDVQVLDYIVKVSNATSRRSVYTCMKELLITQDVYNSSYNSINGSSIVCKPFFGCMIWTGKKWRYVIIFEKARGAPLPQVTTTLNKIFHCNYVKTKIMQTLTLAAKQFWSLGYAHNDLRGANVIYDLKTHTVKFIDLETAVRLPDNVIEEVREKLAKVQEEGYYSNFEGISSIFETYCKESAISLLSLSSQVCLSYADEDNLIYNTDDFFLPMSFAII
jgi:hypothetical protein